MVEYIRLFFIGICFVFLSPCSCINPIMDEYRDYIEDCFMFELSNEAYQKELRSRIFFFDTVQPNPGYRQYSQEYYEDYQTVLSFVYNAKDTHTKSTYYRTLEYLYLTMETYESSPEKIDEYRDIVNRMQINYNNRMVEMSDFKRIGRKKYLIVEEMTGSTCELTVFKNYNISLNMHINKDSL